MDHVLACVIFEILSEIVSLSIQAREPRYEKTSKKCLHCKTIKAKVNTRKGGS